MFSSEMNWFILQVFLILMFLSFWIKPTRISISKSILLKYFAEQFEIALKSKKDGPKLMFLSIFLLIVLSNLCGLIPNSFTATSHLTTNLFLSVPMWTGFFIFGWVTFTNKMLAHLVPNGTPTALISFMVLIELISTSIRPFTLSIRLMANMVSGHLLLTLLGNSMVNISFIILMVMVLVQTMLALLETGVCLIQAYVFCMLLTLYSDESDYAK
uniref:ATP synthase subunit a n=1 Tax=Scirtothrips dorsalis TaxID=163899 RepID=A0A089N346_SCIDO|nr:ATP synthase F0 subunit 6 [Scirtothrips dorsalis]AIQ81002.1 ATP Synthase subunit 6 [Scirtothrips dorsalis]